MPVNAAVADIERAGDVDYSRLGEPVAAQHVLGDFENALRGQNNCFIHMRTVCLSLSVKANESVVAAGR